ncbi:phage tail assembly chaperone [Aurantimonas sp. VKM B-3413]|uniref:phage tail assembly chaperone n=1 Tax=Aurantimonas sp. VKM B-3413 TaxID=2779401 RepID=UPI002103A31F|nr:phage tail assembly chaperone [Aurantimonas sp. VKM B-3413]MCB8836095.1 phage tail assembly chaperone [Aurantimonas sp. VKM B-3413]
MRAAPADGAAGAAFPWDEAMALGIGLMGLSPAEFWTMTPRELAAAAIPHLPAHVGAPGRDDLAALMRRFPDRG